MFVNCYARSEGVIVYPGDTGNISLNCWYCWSKHWPWVWLFVLRDNWCLLSAFIFSTFIWTKVAFGIREFKIKTFSVDRRYLIFVFKTNNSYYVFWPWTWITFKRAYYNHRKLLNLYWSFCVKFICKPG